MPRAMIKLIENRIAITSGRCRFVIEGNMDRFIHVYMREKNNFTGKEESFFLEIHEDDLSQILQPILKRNPIE